MRALAVASILCVSLLVTSGAQTARVQVVPDEAGRRVDVIIDGKPFTSYIYPTTLKKPSLFPLRTAKGTLVTRGYPLETRPNERVDHPHHVGLWLNHGNVNGLDFWNNSDAIPAEQAPKMGTIFHRRVVEAKGGADRGELAVEADWVTPDGKTLLREQTRFVFRGTADSRTDRSHDDPDGARPSRWCFKTARKASSASAWRARSSSPPKDPMSTRTRPASPRRAP